MGDYTKAKNYFQKMHDLDPHRTEFTEYFSTTLWHLQEEVDLFKRFIRKHSSEPLDIINKLNLPFTVFLHKIATVKHINIQLFYEK